MKKLLKVQKEMGTLSKNSTNPFFKSEYLNLNDLLDNVTPLLNQHGLVLIQPIENNEVKSVILDGESGNIVAESGMVLPNITDPQKIGSCVTYFRRYTLKSLLAISETDDDANLASKKVELPITKKDKITPAKLKSALSNDNLEALRTLVKNFDLDDSQLKQITNRANELKSK